MTFGGEEEEMVVVEKVGDWLAMIIHEQTCYRTAL
jgi:hypothetical protein